MRTTEEIRERIRMALVEDMNGTDINKILQEPENQFPAFLDRVTNHLYEILVDEITFRRK